MKWRLTRVLNVRWWRRIERCIYMRVCVCIFNQFIILRYNILVYTKKQSISKEKVDAWLLWREIKVIMIAAQLCEQTKHHWIMNYIYMSIMCCDDYSSLSTWLHLEIPTIHKLRAHQQKVIFSLFEVGESTSSMGLWDRNLHILDQDLKVGRHRSLI